MYVCMHYTCLHVYMYYVYMYVCMHACMDGCINVCVRARACMRVFFGVYCCACYNLHSLYFSDMSVCFTVHIVWAWAYSTIEMRIITIQDSAALFSKSTSEDLWKV